MQSRVSNQCNTWAHPHCSKQKYDKKIELLNEAKDQKDRELKIRQAKREKEMALFTISMDLAVSIAEVLKLVASKSKSIIGYVVASLAVAADLYTLFSTAKDYTNVDYSGYYKGGDTGRGMGIYDNNGHEIAGVVHRDEYVIPHWLRTDPQVMNYEKIIEAKRVGSYYNGGEANSSPYVSNDTALLNKILYRLDNPIPAIAYYGQDETIRLKKNIQNLADIESASKF